MSLPSHIDYFSVEGKKNRKKLISPIINKKNKEFWTINLNKIYIGGWALRKKLDYDYIIKIVITYHTKYVLWRVVAASIFK